MAAPVKPRKHASLKKDSFWLVPAIADVNAPKITEINAVSGIYATCFLRADQGGPAKTTNKVTLDNLLCEGESSEALAPASVSMPDIVGAFDPQAAAAHNDKKLFEFLRDGYTGYLVRRQNKENDTDDQAVVGEFYDVFSVDIDDAWPDKSAPGPEGFYQFVCGVAYTGQRALNVAAVAGP